MGAEVIWAMGNHDHRGNFRAGLLGEAADSAPIDHSYFLNGLRVITLDTSVPGFHHGELGADQLEWLAGELATPAPDGTILALHHPPVPSVLDLAVLVELRRQSELAAVLRGSDVRTILAGHLHYSTTAMFAGIPVSVASATCYTQDLNVPVGGTRGRDGGQSFNLVHVYEHTIVHSTVPLGAGPDRRGAGQRRGNPAPASVRPGCASPTTRRAPRASRSRHDGEGWRRAKPQTVRPGSGYFSQGAVIGKYFCRKSVTNSARSAAGTSGKLPSLRQKKSMLRLASNLGR